jgi:hypothetical protein
LYRRRFALFYFWAGTLKVNWEWISGAALYRPLWFFTGRGVIVACAYVVLMELFVSWGLLARRSWIFWSAVAQLALFHVMSWAVVDFFYPILMFLLLSIVVLDRLYPVKGLDYGRECRMLKRGDYFIGTNWACPRALIDKIGGFDESKGLNAAGPVRVGEETDVMRRLLTAGASAFYLPDAVLDHHVRTEKSTLTHIAARAEAAAYDGQIDPLSETPAMVLGYPRWRLRSLVEAGLVTVCAPPGWRRLDRVVCKAAPAVGRAARDQRYPQEPRSSRQAAPGLSIKPRNRVIRDNGSYAGDSVLDDHPARQRTRRLAAGHGQLGLQPSRAAEGPATRGHP